MAEAESFGDATRASRAREEIEFLGAELGRAVGLGGRARRAGSAAERARSAVQRRIKNALARIADAAPDLAAVLGRTVKTGNFCVYRPRRTSMASRACWTVSSSENLFIRQAFQSGKASSSGNAGVAAAAATDRRRTMAT